MNGKFLTLFLLILCNITGSLEAILIEPKAGYFFPTDRKFRRIYGEGGGIYGLEISFLACNCLYGWTSLSYFTQTGHSIGEHNPTRIVIIPLVAGLKYAFYTFKDIDFYVGIGILGTYLHTKDNSPYVIKNVSKCGVGEIWKIGALFNYSSCFFMNFFADYSYMKIPFYHTDHERVVRYKADISGISVGGGIGYRF